MFFHFGLMWLLEAGWKAVKNTSSNRKQVELVGAASGECEIGEVSREGGALPIILFVQIFLFAGMIYYVPLGKINRHSLKDY